MPHCSGALIQKTPLTKRRVVIYERYVQSGEDIFRAFKLSNGEDWHVEQTGFSILPIQKY